MILTLPTVSCISSAEGDLIESILAHVDTLEGEAVFHTDDGRTIKITITRDNQPNANQTVEKTTETCEDEYTKDVKPVQDTFENLAVIFPKVDSIENIFKTLGIWEKACELHEKGLTWRHTAEELGFNRDNMFRELQDDIEECLLHAKELELIDHEQFEYKFGHYSEIALKWVNKIFADTEEPTTDPASILTPINSIEDVFTALGLWEKAHQLHENSMSWSAIAAEFSLTQEKIYRELKDDIEERLHQAKLKGLINYEQYKENLEYHSEIALKWINEIFSN